MHNLMDSINIHFFPYVKLNEVTACVLDRFQNSFGFSDYPVVLGFPQKINFLVTGFILIFWTAPNAF